MSALTDPRKDVVNEAVFDPYGIGEQERLTAITFKATPESSPEPIVKPVSPPSLKPGESAKVRRKARPSKGDAYLLRIAYPNAPEVTSQAEHHLPSADSGDDESMEDVADMDERMAKEMAEREERERREREMEQARRDGRRISQTAEHTMQDATTTLDYALNHIGSKTSPASSDDVQQIAADALRMSLGSPPHHQDPDRMDQDLVDPMDTSKPPPIDEDMRKPSTRGLGIMTTIKTEHALPPLYPMTPMEPRFVDTDHFGFALPSGQHRNSVASSGESLPAMSPAAQEGPASPQMTKLPSVRGLFEVAERTNEVLRQRSQSMAAPSPAASGPFMRSSISGPVMSPNFGNDPTSPKSSLALSPPSGLTGPRRESYPTQLSSATTNESYTSDATSPSNTLPTPQSESHRPSIDEHARTLPIVHPEMRHSSISGVATVPASGTGFKCDFPGCTAAPFQTSYLLNSHANVHSTNRPHFCPVPGCPRAEGGKGFKRKNEMIRHGLVHDSPGYICPFCPDREHKYPRPDNLQRHVRVHHVDKSKEDPLLRDVLAQRPEAGTLKGRRKRMMSG